MIIRLAQLASFSFCISNNNNNNNNSRVSEGNSALQYISDFRNIQH